jgi:hypothetical protein
MAKHHPDLIMCMKQPGIGTRAISYFESTQQSFKNPVRKVVLTNSLCCSDRTALREMCALRLGY